MPAPQFPKRSPKLHLLINRDTVRRYIMDQIALIRPGWNCTRVSDRVFPELDARLRNMIRQEIHNHPTLGKTFNIQ